MNGVAKMPKLGMQPIRRRQLIDATLDAINEVGMHDATIAQIARRAGVSTGIISHYFKDKNGLLEATMRDITSQLRDAVLNRLHALPDGSASQRLQAIVGGNFDETQISSAAMKAWLAFWASSMHQPMLYRYSRSARRACCRTWCTYLPPRADRASRPARRPGLTGHGPALNRTACGWAARSAANRWIKRWRSR